MALKKIVFLVKTRNQKRYYIQMPCGSVAQDTRPLFPWSDEFTEELGANVWPCAWMRSFMTSLIISKYAPEEREIVITNDPDIHDSIVIVCRHLMNRKLLLAKLRLKNNIVLVDIVDGFLRSKSMIFIHGLICCSRKGFDQENSRLLRRIFNVDVHFVQHCLDIFIPSSAYTCTESIDILRAGYFGIVENLYLPKSLHEKIDVFSINESSVCSPAWRDGLRQVNFHYAVRPPMNSRRCKPFIKGFTAAAYNANMMIHENDGDALYYLGEDYPYLLRGELTDESILACYEKAEREFGGPEWQRGLAKMAEVRARCTDEVVARQFWEMISCYD